MRDGLLLERARAQRRGRGCGARLPISASRLSSAFAPAPTPITAIRPRVARALEVAPGGSARPPARGSRRTARAPRSASGATAVAPSSSTSARRSSSPHRGRPPTPRRRGRAAPRPCRRRPPPPCTSSRSPGRSSAWVKSASWAVVNTSGTPPAAGQSSASGTGIAARSCTTESSAWPPPPTTAITRSPSSKRMRPVPSATTSPASSRPGMSGRSAGRRRVGALALQHVGPVEARRPHPRRAPRPCPARGRGAPPPRGGRPGSVTARTRRKYCRVRCSPGRRSGALLGRGREFVQRWTGGRAIGRVPGDCGSAVRGRIQSLLLPTAALAGGAHRPRGGSARAPSGASGARGWRTAAASRCS